MNTRQRRQALIFPFTQKTPAPHFYRQEVKLTKTSKGTSVTHRFKACFVRVLASLLPASSLSFEKISCRDGQENSPAPEPKPMHDRIMQNIARAQANKAKRPKPRGLSANMPSIKSMYKSMSSLQGGLLMYSNVFSGGSDLEQRMKSSVRRCFLRTPQHSHGTCARHVTSACTASPKHKCS